MNIIQYWFSKKFVVAHLWFSIIHSLMCYRLVVSRNICIVYRMFVFFPFYRQVPFFIFFRTPLLAIFFDDIALMKCEINTQINSWGNGISSSLEDFKTTYYVFFCEKHVACFLVSKELYCCNIHILLTKSSA